MSKINNYFYFLGILLVSLIFTATTAYASPIVPPAGLGALPSGWSYGSLAGGEYIVVDDAGNEWLSPHYTVGHSVNSTLSSSYVTSDGFHVATAMQFDSLLRSFFELSYPGSTFNAYTDTNGNGVLLSEGEYFSGLGNLAVNFLTTFGQTNKDIWPNGVWFTADNYGLVTDSGAPGGYSLAAVRQLHQDAEYGGMAIIQGSGVGYTADFQFAGSGTWMIRPGSTVVSEPPTLLLFISALCVIGMIRARKIKLL